ncbi:translation initiation factor IF-2-like [Lynx rufus]|uniref:translation initiation factor IF-2-like n=1 Tax=Lynx rufus TaxID=61384 RepID=UPI001F126202|nr:translation initiation factor IF-2-like [Lynx rufus]
MRMSTLPLQVKQLIVLSSQQPYEASSPNRDIRFFYSSLESLIFSFYAHHTRPYLPQGLPHTLPNPPQTAPHTPQCPPSLSHSPWPQWAPEPARRPSSPVGPDPSTLHSPKSAHTLHQPPEASLPAPAPNVLQHLPGAPGPPSYPDPRRRVPPHCPRPPLARGRDPVPTKVRKAARCPCPKRPGHRSGGHNAGATGARIAPGSPPGPPRPPPPLLRTHNKQCGARAGSANRLNRRLNRRPPGTARRAGAYPAAAAYPRRRALPAPGPRSRSAAAATSSARVSGSSAQRRRLRRLLPWWRSRLQSPLRRRRRRRARDTAQRAHWPSRGAGPAAAGERKARPFRQPAPAGAVPRRRLRQLRTWERAGTTRRWRPHAPASGRLRKLRPRLSPGARPPPAAAPEPCCASGVTAAERGRAAQGGKRNPRKLRNFRIWERLPDAAASGPLRPCAPVRNAPQTQRLCRRVGSATPPQVKDGEASGL